MKIEWFALGNEESPAFLDRGMPSRVLSTTESHGPH